MSSAGAAGAVCALPTSPRPAPSARTGPTSNHQHLHFFDSVLSLPTGVHSAGPGQSGGGGSMSLPPTPPHSSCQPKTGRSWCINTPRCLILGKTTLRCGMYAVSPAGFSSRHPQCWQDKVPIAGCLSFLVSFFFLTRIFFPSYSL